MLKSPIITRTLFSIGILLRRGKMKESSIKDKDVCTKRRFKNILPIVGKDDKGQNHESPDPRETSILEPT